MQKGWYRLLYRRRWRGQGDSPLREMESLNPRERQARKRRKWTEMYSATWFAARQEGICPHPWRRRWTRKRWWRTFGRERGGGRRWRRRRSHIVGNSLRTESRSSVSRTREPIPVFALPSYRGWRPPLFRGVAVAIPLSPCAAWIFRALQIPPRASTGRSSSSGIERGPSSLSMSRPRSFNFSMFARHWLGQIPRADFGHSCWFFIDECVQKLVTLVRSSRLRCTVE